MFSVSAPLHLCLDRPSAYKGVLKMSFPGVNLKGDISVVMYSFKICWEVDSQWPRYLKIKVLLNMTRELQSLKMEEKKQETVVNPVFI